jgi:hypothetical protein
MASAYLSKTFAQAGNRRTFTISYWIKMNGSTSSNPGILDAGADGSNSDDLYLHTGRLNFSGYYGSTQYQVRTNAKYVDTSGWYHHVIRFDTTQSTASDRLRLYVNGEVQTDLANNTYPSQNFQTTYINTARLHTIGSFATGSLPNTPFDGQMAHFHFTDGYSYAASTFGETDVTTGIWKPKTAPSVTYGTNGFFLKFDNSANMGLDSSGQGNNWTTNGTIIQNKDTPSNIFATLNPNARRITTNNPTYSNTNSSLQGQTGNGQNNNAIATLGDLAKGKYYFECKVGTVGDDFGVGICDDPINSNGSLEGNHEILYKNDGTKWNGSGYVSYGASYTTGDIIGCAFDVTAGTISFYKNGVSQGTAATDLASSLVHGYTPGGYTNKGLMHFNFGNGYFGTTAVSSAQNPTDGVGIFEYTPPTNYRAVCTKSINAQEYS